MGANDYQVGGSHYQGKQAEYQHWDWVTDSGMHYLFACPTKYVIRWRDKGGIKDLEKAIHYLAKAEERCVHYYSYETHQKLMLLNDQYRDFYNAIPIRERNIVHAILMDNTIKAKHLLAELISNEDFNGEADAAYTNQG